MLAVFILEKFPLIYRDMCSVRPLPYYGRLCPMERTCQSYGCFEIAKEGRRLCVMHYNQSQAEYNRRRRAKVCTNVDDEYRAKIEGANKIWMSVLANEETVKRQEEGLRRIGYERPKKESGFLDEIKRIL